MHKLSSIAFPWNHHNDRTEEREVAAQTDYQSLQESKESESANLQEMLVSLAKEFEVGHCCCVVLCFICACTTLWFAAVSLYQIKMSSLTSMYHSSLSYLHGSYLCLYLCIDVCNHSCTRNRQRKQSKKPTCPWLVP